MFLLRKINFAAKLRVQNKPDNNMRKFNITILTLFTTLFLTGQVKSESIVTINSGQQDSLAKMIIRMNSIDYHLNSIPQGINPNWIEEVEVIKSVESKLIYGDNNGVVLIHPKKRNYQEIKSILELEVTLKDQRINSIQKELSLIVDDIVRFRLYRVSAIQMETMPVFKSNFKNREGEVSNNIAPSEPPPPPPGVDRIEYSHYLFKALVDRELLDSIEADFMYSSINPSSIYKIDSSLVSRSLVSKEHLDSLFTQGMNYAEYDRIEREFGTSCFIRVATPIYNESRDKLILAIDYYCGPLWGQGYVFVLMKENNRWLIIEESGTWES